MKKRIVSFLMALVMAVSLLPITSLAEDTQEDYDLRVLTFEDADYKGGDNFAGGTDWSSLIDDPQYGGKLLYGSDGTGVTSEEDAYKWTDENNTWLHNVLSQGYGSWCYWSGGHAISNYVSSNIAAYGGFESQLTVYKASADTTVSRMGGGHNGSDNFAVHFGYADNSGYGLGEDALPALTFADGAERVIDHMYVTNTTYALNCYIDGNGLTAKIGDDDWVKLVAIGYDASGTKTGEASIYLCNGPDNIVRDWTKWDLSGLGKINKVTFNVTGSSDNGYGFSQPAYFAYDDVAVRFEKNRVPAESVTLSETTLALTEGGSATLTATATPENTTDELAWTSSDNEVATVNNGTVTAVAAGTATITAICGSAKVECAVTVSAAPAGPISVKVGDKSYRVKPIDGQAGKYHAAVPYGSDVTVTIDADASAFFLITDAKGNYTDFYSNPFTATAAQLDKLLISKDIPFTPATSASKIAYLSIMDAAAGTTYELYIELTREAVPATGVELDKTELTLHPTEKATLAATVAPENTTDTLVWTSSNDAVATVKDGVVTAKSEGTATITATCGSVKAECAVTVLPPVPASEVTLDKTVLTLYEGDAAKLTATVMPEDTTDKTIVWTSSDNEVATVNNGTVTGLKAGTATITAACGQVKAECSITVKAPVAPSQKDGAYQLGTADELAWFIKQVNSGNTTLAAVLTADVDLNNVNWTPIGSYSAHFAGSFDGAGHTIKNLAIDYQTAKSGERLYLGLFGYVEGTSDAHAVIKDLTVQGSVNARSEFSVYSGNVAGVMGYGKYADVSGVISRVDVTVDTKVGNACGVGGLAGALVDGTMVNCGNEGDVSGVKDLGGLCYELYAGTMTGCYNTGDVKGSGTYVGGVMGYAKQAVIKDVYNTGAVSTAKNMVGGLVGVMDGSSLTNGYSTGTVTVAEAGGNAVGAAVGWADTLANIYYLEGAAEAGIGRDDTGAASAAAKTADELTARTMPAALGSSFKRDLGRVNGGYPVLVWQDSECTSHIGGTPVVENEIPATCIRNGSHDEVVYCTICDAEVRRDTVTDNALGHDWVSAAGKCRRCSAVCSHTWENGACTVCGYVCQHADGGAVTENVKAATCVKDGSHDEVVYCAVCGVEMSRDTVTDKAPGHKAKAAVRENEIPAACVKDGSHDEVVYCSVCEEEMSRDTVTDKAPGHKWNAGVVTAQPTIAKEGVMTFTCAVCKAVKTEAVAKLTEEQKDQSAANDVINLINSIGSVSKDSKDKIDTARKAYDSLTTAQQKLVGNYTVLTTAETTYAGLPAVKADQEAADAAIAKINAIGTVTRGSKSLIDAARKAYDSLTDAQKALVPASVVKVLTDAEETYASLPTRHGTGTGNTADSTQPAQSSRTGDMGIAVYAAMSLLSVTGGAWVIGRKRRQ